MASLKDFILNQLRNVASPLRHTRYQQGIDRFQDNAQSSINRGYTNARQFVAPSVQVSNRVNPRLQELLSRQLQSPAAAFSQQLLTKPGFKENLSALNNLGRVSGGLPGLPSPQPRPANPSFKLQQPTDKAQEFIKSSLRSAPRATVSLLQRRAGMGDTFTPTTKFENLVLGKEPVKSFQTGTPSTYLKGKGVNPRLSEGLGGLAVIGSIAADVTGAGKAKGAAKLFASAKNAAAVENIARKTGIKLTPELTAKLVKETNSQKIATTLAEHMRKPVAKVPEGESQLTDLYNQATGANALGRKVTQPGKPNQISTQGLLQTTDQSLVNPATNRILGSSLAPSVKTSKLNVNRLEVSKPAKQELEAAVADIAPRLEQSVGRKLSHSEIRASVADTTKELSKVMTREQTAEMGARALALRQKIAALAEDTAQSGRATPELLDALETDLSFSSNIARLLGQRRINAEPVSKGIAENYIRAVMNAGAKLEDIKKAANGVDFNDPDQAALFYRQFVKPSLGEWVDVIRYNSMLSSPLTHIVNIASNIQAGPVRALTKTVAGGVDWVGSGFGKNQRNQFAGEGLAYAQGYYGQVNKAWKNLVGVMKGEILPELTDFRESNIPLAVTGKAGAIESGLSVPMKLLEGMDQFFMTLSRGGEANALSLRQAKGGKLPASASGLADEIEKGAQASIFRTKLGTKGQGKLLETIDDLALVVSNLRNSDNKLTSTIAKFTFPFLQTPTNIFKQGLEYSPVGFLNIPGSVNKAETIAKAIMGSAVVATAAGLLTSDRLTFGEPDSEKERLLWKEAGKQAYSVKIGDTWVSYNKVHPALAFPLAMVAGVQDAIDRKKITDSDGETILSAAGNVFNFMFDQSYMKSMGAFLDAAKGVEGSISKMAGNYLQQLVPGRALGGWFARALDDYERTTTPGAGFWQKQFESLIQNVPGMRGFSPARLDSSQGPIRSQNPLINAISPLRTSTTNSEGEIKLDLYRENSKAKRDAEALRTDVKNEIKAEQMRSAGGAQAAGVSTKPASGLEPGVSKKGSYYVYTVDGEVKITQDERKANSEMGRENFKKTGKNIGLSSDGTKVYRLASDGDVTTMPKTQFDYSLNSNKLAAASLAKDYKTWTGVADQQFEIIKKQLQDPTLDELEKSEIIQKATTLANQYLKYKDYGGFTKPKKGKKLKVIRGGRGLSSTTISRAKASLPTIKTKTVKLPTVKTKTTKIKLGGSGGTRKYAGLGLRARARKRG